MRQAVVLERVSKTYRTGGPPVEALRGVSLEIADGEVFGLLGPNGAGKTTLLYLLTGVLEPDAGAIRIFDSPPGRHGPQAPPISYVSADARFHWALQVRDILRLDGMMFGLGRDALRRQTQALTDQMDLAELMTRRFDTLSTGQKARVILARGLLNRPRLLLLDEPTLGLDPDMAQRIRGLIRRIQQEHHTTVLLTSHYMAEVEQLAERVGFLHRGRLLDVGPIRELVDRHGTPLELRIRVEAADSGLPPAIAGFTVKDGELVRPMRRDEPIGPLLDDVARQCGRILSVQTLEPTLEDYFVRMVEGQR